MGSAASVAGGDGCAAADAARPAAPRAPRRPPQITAYRAGHVLGAAMFMVDIQVGFGARERGDGWGGRGYFLWLLPAPPLC